MRTSFIMKALWMLPKFTIRNYYYYSKLPQKVIEFYEFEVRACSRIYCTDVFEKSCNVIVSSFHHWTGGCESFQPQIYRWSWSVREYNLDNLKKNNSIFLKLFAWKVHAKTVKHGMVLAFNWNVKLAPPYSNSHLVVDKIQQIVFPLDETEWYISDMKRFDFFQTHWRGIGPLKRRLGINVNLSSLTFGAGTGRRRQFVIVWILFENRWKN